MARRNYKAPKTLAEARLRIFQDGMPFVEGRCAHETCSDHHYWRHDQCSAASIGYGPDGLYCIRHARMVLMPIETLVVEPEFQVLKRVERTTRG